MSFHSLEHKFIKKLKESYGAEEKEYVLFCSGGLDSISLLHLFLNVRPVFNYSLKVVYVHHGSLEFSVDHEEEQSGYRSKAESFVSQVCSTHNLQFDSIKSPKFLKSEEECRNFRVTAYDKYINQSSRVFLAHHRDDHFETLLIRLLRGTGPTGLKNPFSKNVERPLVEICSRAELEAYQKDMGFEFLNDPSNKDKNYLRNWLRLNWIKQLEDGPYGAEPFKNSLMQLSEFLSQAEPDKEDILFFNQNNEGFFNLTDYMNLKQVQKKALISNALHKLKKTGYTSGQVLEVLKLLELKDQALEFKISGIDWKKTKTKVYFQKA